MRVREIGATDARQQRVDAGIVVRGGEPQQATRASGVRQARQPHVFAHGHRRERGRNLEGAADPAARDRMRGNAVDARPRQRDAARVGNELSVDEIEAGRLAGAVGSDQRDQFAGRDGKRHVVDGAYAAERLGETA